MSIDSRVGVSVISERKKATSRAKLSTVKKGVFPFCSKIVNWESSALSKNGLMLTSLSSTCLPNTSAAMLGSFAFSTAGMTAPRIMA